MNSLRSVVAVIGLVSVASSGATEPSSTPVSGAAPAVKASKAAGKTMTVATIKTAKGTIKFTLLPQYAPNTVDNFVKLANKKFYDGLAFHRVVPGFVIQGGDPAGNGSGGPGYTIKAEFSARKHLLGTVAMARTPDPDSAGSQFYICLAALPSLDNQYTVFGQVFEGQDVVNAITVGDKMTTVRISQVAASKIPEAARN